MAVVDNIVGQLDKVKHRRGTYFDKTFQLSLTTGEAFEDLTLFNISFIIKEKNSGKVLYRLSDGEKLVITDNTFRIKDKIDIPVGVYDFELIAVSKQDTNVIYKPWYGDFVNEK